ncbi:hypothetical protein VD0004_g3046 [Verticillium dahliae]|nr:hypothetical protein VD0004_g3046 [Verticillium dahliae]PNH74495.1 hypothetical protein VD0001_g3046 [Verticillium dahliae]
MATSAFEIRGGENVSGEGEGKGEGEGEGKGDNDGDNASRPRAGHQGSSRGHFL